MESFTRHEEKAVALAAGVIVDLTGAYAVWCFAHRSRVEGCSGNLFAEIKNCGSDHLYLLAFVPDGNTADDGVVGEAIAKKSGGCVTATVLLYRESRLARVKGNHQTFLDKIVRGADPLFVKKGYVIPESGNAAENNSAKVAYWNHCKYMAICCLEAETAIENPHAELMQAVLLRQAVELVCLGTIYVQLGCRPNYHELGYLLDLCAICLDEVRDIFPRNTSEESARFAVLSRTMETLRYRADLPSITDIEILRLRAHRFLGAAGNMVEEQLTGKIKKAA
jgi:hypothetical protein